MNTAIIDHLEAFDTLVYGAEMILRTPRTQTHHPVPAAHGASDEPDALGFPSPDAPTIKSVFEEYGEFWVLCFHNVWRLFFPKNYPCRHHNPYPPPPPDPPKICSPPSPRRIRSQTWLFVQCRLSISSFATCNIGSKLLHQLRIVFGSPDSSKSSICVTTRSSNHCGSVCASSQTGHALEEVGARQRRSPFLRRTWMVKTDEHKLQ